MAGGESLQGSQQGWRCYRKDSSKAEVFTWRLLWACAVSCDCVQGSHVHTHACSPKDGGHNFLEILKGVCDPSKIQWAGRWEPPGSLPTLRSHGPSVGAQTSPGMRDKEAGFFQLYASVYTSLLFCPSPEAQGMTWREP